MRWIPIEVDLLGGLERAAALAPPRYLVGPPDGEAAEAIRDLVLREAREYHALEREVTARRIDALRADAAALADGDEHDRAGHAGPRSQPGHATTLGDLERAEARLVEHDAALARLENPGAIEEVDRLLARCELRPRADLEALKAADGEGAVIELHADGYALAGEPAERLATRRAFLGLPTDRDWTE